MTRVCMRPGCDRPAEARLSYDTVSCQVWLDRMPDRAGPVQEICEFHALRLTVPRGWTLCDRRVDAPALFLTGSDSNGGRVRPELPPVPSLNGHGEPPAMPDSSEPEGTERPRLGGDQIGDLRPLRRRHPSVSASELFGDEAVAQQFVGSIARSRSAAETADSNDNELSETPAESSSDEAGDESAPTSPLLAKAFAQTGPQRSALSDELRGKR